MHPLTMAAAVVLRLPWRPSRRRDIPQAAHTLRYKSTPLELESNIIITLHTTILVKMCGLCAR